MTDSILLCKLTDQQLRTYRGFQWVPGEWAPELSGSESVYHCYEHPLLAVLLNPIHANIENPWLWLVEVKGKPITYNGLKRGYKTMRLTEEHPRPTITTEQRVAFAIHCALAVYPDPAFVAWAEKWLSGVDRTYEAARAAWSAEAVARAAWSAEAVARAAWAAAEAETVVRTARAAAEAETVVRTARAAVLAAWSAAETEGKDFDLIKLAELAVQ